MYPVDMTKRLPVASSVKHLPAVHLRGRARQGVVTTLEEKDTTTMRSSNDVIRCQELTHWLEICWGCSIFP